MLTLIITLLLSLGAISSPEDYTQADAQTQDALESIIIEDLTNQ